MVNIWVKFGPNLGNMNYIHKYGSMKKMRSEGSWFAAHS